jgi:hypothetical protein
MSAAPEAPKRLPGYSLLIAAILCGYGFRCFVDGVGPSAAETASRIGDFVAGLLCLIVAGWLVWRALR